VSRAELEALLVVQERDTALDRLRHRRATLPERAQLDARTGDAGKLQSRRDAVQRERDSVHAEERRLDDEARAIEAHAADVEKHLYSGSTTSPRELQAMQADLDMLKRQVSELEDQELEVMDRRETLDAALREFDASLASITAEQQRLREAIAVAEGEIDAEIAVEEQERVDVAGGVSDGLLRDYDKRRAQNKGAGAARLTGTTCNACHLTIPSTEAERIRRAEGNEVAYCENCGAILVP
jgi:predicted  nucleic acid-binding Zn-ribbon protein